MSKLSQVSVYIAVLIALLSAKPWFIWGYSYVEIIVLFLFIISRLFIMNKTILKRDGIPTLFCVILSLYIYVLNAPDIDTAFSQTCTQIIPLCLFIQFNGNEKKLFIETFTTLFSIILLVSLCSFILFHLGFSVPYTRLSHTDAHYSEFYNYYTFIIDGHLGIFTRFRSIFTEPGHVGMFAAILMYVNNFKMKKWKLIVLLVSIIWSFSLAAYILIILGFVLYSVLGKKIKTGMLLAPILLLVGYALVNSYYRKNPDSLFSKLIISRLEIKENGKMAGNNRHTSEFMAYYNKFEITPDYITGLGSSRYAQLKFLSGNASYKNYILEHGVLGIVLLIAFGVSFLKPYYSPRYLGLFILYFAAFLQRPYALWEVESFLYVAYSCNVIGLKYNYIVRKELVCSSINSYNEYK